MKLKKLLEHIDYLRLSGPDNPEITGIESDSRKVQEGYIFIAGRGLHTDGHNFIPAAIKNGANTVICRDLPGDLPGDVTFIEVLNPEMIIGILASAFYGFPSKKMKVVGITGTNGKTSIATLLYKLFCDLGFRTGLISTISYKINESEETASHTTPDALKIQRLMADMVKENCSYCFMEVSSHALHQHRIAGIEFTGGVFSNITHDHLDYHKTFSEYIRTKKSFFDQLPVNAFAVINIDDKNGPVMVQNSKAKVITFSTRSVADFHCKVLEYHLNGMLLKIGAREVWTRFTGLFNASNLLAVFAVCMTLKLEEGLVLTAISNLEP
ncbi:MAG: UDP-N-acetylmuramoyl-L-alanyl-D-glutamate--2,6-diaminopimelate ligase, partial [Prolixibacteraceae bacterium]|nr:UDP-N-acetylmuramoyl-L-alanyl-D-glutamate--2,6-diaminopimelate ligase [Prolixibacteraceae bacterium]